MAKGGARSGAGRPGYKVKGEQLKRIDIRDLSRRKLLAKASSFTWSWNRGGEPTGSISISVYPQQAVNLIYTMTDNGQACDINDRVSLIQRPCHFGGERSWFRCPRCSRQVSTLYLRGGRFACRHCQRVAYSSQSEDMMARTLRKQRQIEATIGEDWQRPSGMRQRTYERLLDQLVVCEQKRDEAFCVPVARLVASFEH